MKKRKEKTESQNLELSNIANGEGEEEEDTKNEAVERKSHD